MGHLHQHTRHLTSYRKCKLHHKISHEEHRKNYGDKKLWKLRDIFMRKKEKYDVQQTHQTIEFRGRQFTLCCGMIDICTRCFKLCFFLFNDNNKYLNLLCTILYLIATSIRTKFFYVSSLSDEKYFKLMFLLYNNWINGSNSCFITFINFILLFVIILVCCALNSAP